ncbi:uncharacterized protein LOC125423616 isoform X2 [Ziziphus jujuba]|uniref:Uncharacterized protein LOC125423616 isoform X2 n=1 Tax=Ziziphus jujuba TaxID=326968 RepID=A0ABM4A127_ZIZJJ|nr:uncharacterized protein LOC125423616 isoform X2 [Ziziphus jujuba]
MPFLFFFFFNQLHKNPHLFFFNLPHLGSNLDRNFSLIFNQILHSTSIISWIRGMLFLFPFEAALFLLLERGLPSERHLFAALQFENPTALSKDLGISLIATKEGNFLEAERIFLGGPKSAGKFFQCTERRGRRRRRRKRERDESVFEFRWLHQIENEVGPFLGGVVGFRWDISVL